MLRGRDLATRDRLLAHVERLARVPTAAFDIGVVLLVGAEVAARFPDVSTALTRAGRVVAAMSIVAQLGPLLWPTGSSEPERVYSATAARYRTRPSRRG